MLVEFLRDWRRFRVGETHEIHRPVANVLIRRTIAIQAAGRSSEANAVGSTDGGADHQDGSQAAPGNSGIGHQHDNELDVLIASARLKLEEDTGLAVISQTYTQVFPVFADGLRLARKPISSVSSISYYDGGNNSQTLSTDVYAFDASTQQIRLKADQSWPDVYSRWDAITVTFVAGYANAAAVPANIKHALLTLCAFYFDLDRGDNPNPPMPRTYYNLITNVTRATYP
jgi:uncharacterized phiE125 gp8 family phage protein